MEKLITIIINKTFLSDTDYDKLLVDIERKIQVSHDVMSFTSYKSKPLLIKDFLDLVKTSDSKYIWVINDYCKFYHMSKTFELLLTNKDYEMLNFSYRQVLGGYFDFFNKDNSYTNPKFSDFIEPNNKYLYFPMIGSNTLFSKAFILRSLNDENLLNIDMPICNTHIMWYSIICKNLPTVKALQHYCADVYVTESEKTTPFLYSIFNYLDAFDKNISFLFLESLLKRILFVVNGKNLGLSDISVIKGALRSLAPFFSKEFLANAIHLYYGYSTVYLDFMKELGNIKEFGQEQLLDSYIFNACSHPINDNNIKFMSDFDDPAALYLSRIYNQDTFVAFNYSENSALRTSFIASYLYNNRDNPKAFDLLRNLIILDTVTHKPDDETYIYIQNLDTSYLKNRIFFNKNKIAISQFGDILYLCSSESCTLYNELLDYYINLTEADINSVSNPLSYFGIVKSIKRVTKGRKYYYGNSIIHIVD